LASHLQQCRTPSSPLERPTPGQNTSTTGHRHCGGRTSRRASCCSKRSTAPGCTGRLDQTGLGGHISPRAPRAAPLALPPSWQKAPP
jgi:hypothetical protein